MGADPPFALPPPPPPLPPPSMSSALGAAADCMTDIINGRQFSNDFSVQRRRAHYSAPNAVRNKVSGGQESRHEQWIGSLTGWGGVAPPPSPSRSPPSRSLRLATAAVCLCAPPPAAEFAVWGILRLQWATCITLRVDQSRLQDQWPPQSPGLKTQLDLST